MVLYYTYALADMQSNSRRTLRYRDDDSDTQKGATTLQERRNVLQARLNHWFKIQTAYIPIAQNLRTAQHSDDGGAGAHLGSNEELEDANPSSADYDAEKVKLYLPSQLPLSLWSTGCMHGLHKTELRLRVAQASDTLEQLKQQLLIYSGFVRYKIDQVSGPGQKANTRARNLLVRFREKVKRCAEQYRASRAVLEILDSAGDWKQYLRPLLESDLKGPNGSSPDDPVAAMSKQSKRMRGGEGFREISWIWRVQRTVPHSIAEGLGGSEGSRVTTEADVDKCEFSVFMGLHY